MPIDRQVTLFIVVVSNVKAINEKLGMYRAD